MPGFDLGRIFSDCNGVGLSGESRPISNTIETARLNRFIFTMSDPNFPLDVEIACEYIERPIARVQKERVWNGGDYINVPLRLEYDPISIKFYEILRDSNDEAYLNYSARAISDWLSKASFNSKNSRQGFARHRRISTRIMQLNGLGEIIWTYKLLRCWPEIITPDALNYKISDISKIQISLNFDKVIETREF